jgi:hypothetical protein
LQVLEEERPEIVLLDEIDKMSGQFAEKLLNFLESGRIKVDQKKCQMDFELKGCKDNLIQSIKCMFCTKEAVVCRYKSFE